MPSSNSTISTPPTALSPEVKQKLSGALQRPVASMRALTKGSLYYFIQYFWDTYSQDPFVGNWHIEYLCKELEEIARRVAAGEKKKYDLIINISPGSTKTATVSIFFPVWCWVNWYWMKFITSSHGDKLSLESAEFSRDVIKSDKFQILFPDIAIKQDKDVKSNFRVVRKEYVNVGRAPRIHSGGGRVSTSVDARITGFHAHIIIPDDIIDPRRAISEVGLTNAQEHLKALATRKTSKEVSATIMIMQRLAQEDPTGWWLEQDPEGVKQICIPGEIRNYKKYLKPPELEKYYIDDLMDPKRMSWESLASLKKILGQYGFAGQVGQNPTPPGGGMFKMDNVQVIDRLNSDINIVRTVRYWDKAATEGGTGARSAGVKLSLLKNGKIVIHDSRKGRWATEERERNIKATTEADALECSATGTGTGKARPYTVGIEQEPGSGGKESAEATIKNLRGFHVVSDRPTGDKAFRADPFSVAVNIGDVIAIRGEWWNDFKQEFELFPLGAYKDQVDAGSAAYNMLVGRREARVIR
jgi:predicted phage terminase large subunit-like protein